MIDHDAWEIRSFLLPYPHEERKQRLAALAAEGFEQIGNFAAEFGFVGFFRRVRPVTTAASQASEGT